MEFVVCINNKDYPADLLLHKIYRVIPNPNIESDDIRVVDESGEDYVYPKSYFVSIQVPPEVRESLLIAARKPPRNLDAKATFLQPLRAL